MSGALTREGRGVDAGVIKEGRGVDAARAIADRLDAAGRMIRLYGDAGDRVLSEQEIRWFIDRLGEAAAYLRGEAGHNQINTGES